MIDSTLIALRVSDVANTTWRSTREKNCETTFYLTTRFGVRIVSCATWNWGRDFYVYSATFKIQDLIKKKKTRDFHDGLTRGILS